MASYQQNKKVRYLKEGWIVFDILRKSKKLRLRYDKMYGFFMKVISTIPISTL